MAVVAASCRKDVRDHLRSVTPSVITDRFGARGGCCKIARSPRVLRKTRLCSPLRADGGTPRVATTPDLAAAGNFATASRVLRVSAIMAG